MLIQTGRFGAVQIKEDDILNFGEGILGFNGLRKFVLLDDPDDEIFAWLQSCERPEIAFPVLEPDLFAVDYKINLTKSELEFLQMKDLARANFFCIITIPEDPNLMTANLKAPIVINPVTRLAKQCVLQDNDLSIREPIFTKLQQKLMHSMPIRSKAFDQGLAVKLPAPPERALER
jgi:flagellar assembly factor FliW